MAASGIITLLTDYGLSDAYTGSMKGAILAVNPAAVIVDLTHEVPPQDMIAGAWQLRSAHAYFPTRTVHCAVVDPGVGGRRRAIAATAGGMFYVGPDNGLLSWAVDMPHADVRELTNPAFMRTDVSRTFHGRDIFAPVAAHLSLGVPLADLGPRVDNAVALPLPSCTADATGLAGEVLLADRFGNLITSIDAASFDAWAGDGGAAVECVGSTIPIVATYSDAPPGKLAALFGSAGHLEIAVRDCSASSRLRAARGTVVRVVRA